MFEWFRKKKPVPFNAPIPQAPKEEPPIGEWYQAKTPYFRINYKSAGDHYARDKKGALIMENKYIDTMYLKLANEHSYEYFNLSLFPKNDLTYGSSNSLSYQGWKVLLTNYTKVENAKLIAKLDCLIIKHHKDVKKEQDRKANSILKAALSVPCE